jgi:hypothetical protein
MIKRFSYLAIICYVHNLFSSTSQLIHKNVTWHIAFEIPESSVIRKILINPTRAESKQEQNDTFFILDPFGIRPEKLMNDIQEICKDTNYSFIYIPVTDTNKEDVKKIDINQLQRNTPLSITLVPMYAQNETKETIQEFEEATLAALTVLKPLIDIKMGNSTYYPKMTALIKN